MRFVSVHQYVFKKFNGAHWLLFCTAFRPPFILQPHAWNKDLPPHFLKAKQTALLRTVDHASRARRISKRSPKPVHELAHDSRQPILTSIVRPYSQAPNEPGYYNPEAMYESSAMTKDYPARSHERLSPPLPMRPVENSSYLPDDSSDPPYPLDVDPMDVTNSPMIDNRRDDEHRVIEEYAFDDSLVPMDEAIDVLGGRARGFDPPEDEPPSLKKSDASSSGTNNGLEHLDTQYYISPMEDEEPRSPVTDEFVSPVSVGTYYDEPIPSPSMGRPPKKSDVDTPKSTSPAMRGAQEMLRRNRQRRSQETAKRKENRDGSKISISPNNNEGAAADTPKSPESGTTWESESEVTSIGGSSTWTDDMNNPDRSSRRALILQMAKARMRNNNHQQQNGSLNHNDSLTMIESREMEEEKKNDMGQPDEIDLTSDLD